MAFRNGGSKVIKLKLLLLFQPLKDIFANVHWVCPDSNKVPPRSTETTCSQPYFIKDYEMRHKYVASQKKILQKKSEEVRVGRYTENVQVPKLMTVTVDILSVQVNLV